MLVYIGVHRRGETGNICFVFFWFLGLLIPLDPPQSPLKGGGGGDKTNLRGLPQGDSTYTYVHTYIMSNRRCRGKDVLQLYSLFIVYFCIYMYLYKRQTVDFAMLRATGGYLEGCGLLQVMQCTFWYTYVHQSDKLVRFREVNDDRG